MRMARRWLGGIAVAIVTWAGEAPAAPPVARTWVASGGDDVNPCTRAAPCRTFAGALAKTAPGGEIDVVDAGGYGTVTIGKAITIDGSGTLATIVGSGTNGIVGAAGAGGGSRLRGR